MTKTGQIAAVCEWVSQSNMTFYAQLAQLSDGFWVNQKQIFGLKKEQLSKKGNNGFLDKPYWEGTSGCPIPAGKRLDFQSDFLGGTNC